MILVGDIVLYGGQHWQVIDFMKRWLFGSDETAHEQCVMIRAVDGSGDMVVPTEDVTKVRRH